MTISRTFLNLLMVGDFGKDLDDEHALILAKGLEQHGHFKLVGVIANLKPADERARLAKGTLIALGDNNTPVAIGTAVFDGSQTAKYETSEYLAPRDSLVESGREFFAQILRDAEPQSLVLVLNSGMTDAYQALKDNPELFAEKVARVAIMGGVEVDDNGEVKLDNEGRFQASIGRSGAANNTFDDASAVGLYLRLQDLGVPTTVLMRWTAYACQVPFSIYDTMAETDNIVGKSLRGRQRPMLENLWKSANSAEGSEQRGKLPADRDRQWFINTFCGGVDPGTDENVWKTVQGFQLYDGLNVVAAIDSLVERFYEPVRINVGGTEHLVIGPTAKRHGVKDIAALRTFLIEEETSAMTGGSTTR